MLFRRFLGRFFFCFPARLYAGGLPLSRVDDRFENAHAKHSGRYVHRPAERYSRDRSVLRTRVRCTTTRGKSTAGTFNPITVLYDRTRCYYYRVGAGKMCFKNPNQTVRDSGVSSSSAVTADGIAFTIVSLRALVSNVKREKISHRNYARKLSALPSRLRAIVVRRDGRTDGRRCNRNGTSGKRIIREFTTVWTETSRCVV